MILARPRAERSRSQSERLACNHHQCAWCLRLKHKNGQPHGKPWPSLLPGYSHGICLECLAEMAAENPSLSATGHTVVD